MKRWHLVPAIAAMGLAGCAGDELTGGTIRNKAVDVPEVSQASVATAARVDQVGRQLVSQNPFLGVEPTFQTLARKEPEICHPDSNGVIVSEGLVDRCKTDAELAAVLATELARMSAEQRVASRLRKPEPLRPLGDNVGGAGSDQNQLGVQALVDRRPPRSETSTKPSTDTRTAAAEILRSAGFEAMALETVDPLLREAAGNHALADHFGVKGAKPRWSY